MPYADFEATGTSVPFACSVCGRRRLFPDQMVYSDDKLFRCTDSCDERTAYNVDQQRAAWRAPPEPVPSVGGPLPQGDVVTTFLQDAAEFRGQVIPGWTPTNQFYDDFTIVPGGVGSSWTVTNTGDGAVSQPSANVARFAVSASGSARASVVSVSVPDSLSGGRCFIAFRAKNISISGQGLARGGAATTAGANVVAVGVNGFSSAFPFYMVQSVSTQTPVDAAEYRMYYLFWKAAPSSIFGAIGSSHIIATPRSSAAARVPYLAAQNASSTFDVTNYVCWT